MMNGPTKLQELNWGAFDHASHAPQLSIACMHAWMQCIYLLLREDVRLSTVWPSLRKDFVGSLYSYNGVL